MAWMAVELGTGTGFRTWSAAHQVLVRVGHGRPEDALQVRLTIQAADRSFRRTIEAMEFALTARPG